MRLKNVLSLSSTIVATVVGAGFATGQEIFCFFNSYGKWSFLGLAIVFVLFLTTFRFVLECCYFEHVDNFTSFVRNLKLRGVAKWVEGCVALFSFCGLCAMASASGALFSQTLDFPYVYGAFAMLFGCGIILKFDVRAVAGANCILAPIICIGLIYFAIRGIAFRSVTTIATGHYYINSMQILISAIVYVSYNFLSAVVVLCSMRMYCDSVRTIKLASTVSAGALTVIALLLWIVMRIYQNKIPLGEIPLLQIASRGGEIQKNVYSLLLLLSIYSTAVSCGFAVLDFLKTHFHMTSGIGVIICLLMASPVCMLGFSSIVRVLYSVFGYLGLPFLGILIYSKVKIGRKTNKKSKNIENA